jgi:xkdS protein
MILPSFITQEIKTFKENQKYIDAKEFAFDFNEKKMIDGTVEKKSAVKIWIYNTLKTERYRWEIYSWQYGASLEQYIGKSYSDAYINDSVKKEVTEALKVNNNITDVKDFKAYMLDDTTLHMEFYVVTKWGEEVEVYV